MMIESGFVLSGPWAIFAIMAMAVAMLVNRAGASMVFFDVVGRFQAAKLIKDAETSMTVFNAIMLDTFANMQDSIDVIGTGFESVINEVLPMTEAMADAEIELAKFLAEGEDLDSIAEGVREIGVEFGFTGDQAILAAAKMAQLASVLGEGQTEVGTQLGMEFGLISGMETEAAMQRLINLNQQLYFMTEGTEDLADAEAKGNAIRENTLRVMDQLNTIENRSASTMEQVTFVMNQFASQAHLTGESIAMMAAQSAVLIETGEEQGKAGRALKMVYARLGADINGARRELEGYNIAVLDSNDNLRPLSKIMADLAPLWATLEANERQAIAQSVAGNRHYTRFIKLMNNYERSVQLATEAQMAMFPALEEVANRTDAPITKYRAATAELENYRAELGDAFLPAMTNAAQAQGAFTNEVINLLNALGPMGTGLATIGINMKNIVVPLFSVVTNVAALTVAFQAQRAVTRAMAGEQLMLEGAFGNANGQFVQALEHTRDLSQIQQSYLIGARQQGQEITRWSDQEIKDAEELLGTYMERQKVMEGNVQTTKDFITENRRQAVVRQLEKEGVQQNTQEYRELENQIEMLESEYEEFNSTLQAQGYLLDQTQASTEKLSGELSEQRLAALIAEREETDRLNKEAAEQAQLLYAGAGAAFALGSAMMTLSDNQKINRLGMSLNIAATVALTGKQLSLAAATVAKTLADKKDNAGMLLKNNVIYKNIFAMITSTFTTKTATKVSGTKTTVEAIETIGIKAKTRALIAQAAAQVAANAAAIAAVATAGLALAALGGIYLLLNRQEKKRQESMEDLGQTIFDYAQTDSQLFLDTINNEELALSDLADMYDTARGKASEFAAGTTAESKKLAEEQANLAETYGDAFEAKFSEIAAGDIVEEDVQKVLDAQKRIERGVEEPWGMRAKFGPFTDFLLQGQRDEIKSAEKVLEEYEDLVRFIEISQKEGAEAIYQAIQANARSMGDLADSMENDAAMVAGSMEMATRSLIEFNNAREELFYGMNQSNVTGDLVRQVVNRGVEHLLVNTEVIMTNNFNGMTTEQVAQEILDHVERGATMRGVNLTSTMSQTI